MILEPDLLIPDDNLSIAEGGIKGIRGIKRTRGYMQQRISAAGNAFGFSVNEPIKKLSKKNFEILLYGESNTRVDINYRRRGGSTRSYSFIWEGIISHLERRYKEAEGDRVLLEKFMIENHPKVEDYYNESVYLISKLQSNYEISCDKSMCLESFSDDFFYKELKHAEKFAFNKLLSIKTKNDEFYEFFSSDNGKKF